MLAGAGLAERQVMKIGINSTVEFAGDPVGRAAFDALRKAGLLQPLPARTEETWAVYGREDESGNIVATLVCGWDA